MKKLFTKYWMVIIPIFLIASTFLFYCFNFGFFLLENTSQNNLYEKFGQFGDYFGGVVNPVLAFVNIALIAYYQMTDVKRQNENSLKQSQVDNIYKMIELHSSLKNTIIVNESGVQYTGMNAFVEMNCELIADYQTKFKMKKTTTVNKLNLAYTYLFENRFRKQVLAHYFTNLYQIYKMIDESENLSEKEKLQYAKIMRSQLSHLELKFLFLNCISDYGENFQYYVGKYDLLEWFHEFDFYDMDNNILKTKVIQEEREKWKKLTTAST